MYTKNKLVYGVGINDSDSSTWEHGKKIHAYARWVGMLERCYSQTFSVKNPTYIGCTICEEWLHFSNFKKWYDANYKEGFHLDKDILIESNKIYSPDTCVFVPQYLNNLLNDHGRARGDLPLGIRAHPPNNYNRRKNTTYSAQCSDGYGKILTKTFKAVEEAQAWYSVTKPRVVAEQVQRALSEGAIDQRVADALLARKF